MATVEEAVNIVQTTRANVQACQIWYASFRDNTLHKLNTYNTALTETLAQVKQFERFTYWQCPPPDLYVHLAVIDIEFSSSRFQYEQTLSEFLIDCKETEKVAKSQFHIWFSEAVMLKECFTRQRLFNWPSSLPKVTVAEIEAAFENLVSALDHLWFSIQPMEKLLLDTMSTLQKFENSISANTNFDVSNFGVTPNMIYHLMVSILTRHSLIINEQPMQLLKMGSFCSDDAKKRRGNVSMKTSLSLKLLHLNKRCVWLSPEQTVNLYVINAATARNIESKENFSLKEITPNGVMRQQTNSPEGYLSVQLKRTDADHLMEATVANWCISSVTRKSHEDAPTKMRRSRNTTKTRISPISSMSKTLRLHERPPNGGVTHEKFCILAVAPKMTLLPNGLLYNSWTMSAPIVIRSHSSHIGAALATLSWDNYFSNWTRVPFEVQQYAKWEQIQSVLVAHFNDWLEIDVTDTQSHDRTLEPDHLEHLKKKALQHACVDNDENRISLELLYNGNMNGCGFSFWSWFHKVVMLLKTDFFKKAWNFKYIKGFIDDSTADDQLLDCHIPVGTFILKFSEFEKASMIFILATHDEWGNKTLIRTQVNLHNKNTLECVAEFMKHLNVHVPGKLALYDDKTEKAFCFVYPNICVEQAFPQMQAATEEHLNESCYARLVTLLVVPKTIYTSLCNEDRRRG